MKLLTNWRLGSMGQPLIRDRSLREGLVSYARNKSAVSKCCRFVIRPSVFISSGTKSVIPSPSLVLTAQPSRKKILTDSFGYHFSLRWTGHRLKTALRWLFIRFSTGHNFGTDFSEDYETFGGHIKWCGGADLAPGSLLWHLCVSPSLFPNFSRTPNFFRTFVKSFSSYRKKSALC